MGIVESTINIEEKLRRFRKFKQNSVITIRKLRFIEFI
jgi:hypothetical protein